MKKITSIVTYLWNYFVYFILIGVVIFIVIIINAKIYFALIGVVFWIIWVWGTGFNLRHMSDVYIDAGKKLFKIDNFKKQIYLPFNDLVAIKTHYGQWVLELIFLSKRVYIIPDGTVDNLFQSDKDLMIFLKNIIAKKKQ